MTSRWNTSRMRKIAAGAGLAAMLGLFGMSAFAQAPNPNQGLPPGHPPMDQPPPVRGAAPNVGPHGQPVRPGMPAGMPPIGRPLPQPQKLAAPQQHGEQHAGGGHGGHCPGHGPEDAPHFDQINWWQGLIGVNNEKALSPSFADKLLWRYHNGADPCDPKNQEAPLFASLLNLAILGYIVYHFGRKPIGEALVKRKQDIMAEIETASRLEREAKARLDELEGKFERINETRKALKVEYAAQAEVEKKHIIAEAEERRARMRRDAEFRVEQELRATQLALMQNAVANATTAAEEIIRKRTAQADIDRMSEEYLASVRTALAGGATAQLGGKQ
ncbi:MAG TPA: F0F1 ATP synthase subunit B [Polyangium sp.]|nr:F0F1 ATP synthase subunit B [Polyangium sp.]